jgi:hypothetical protein
VLDLNQAFLDEIPDMVIANINIAGVTGDLLAARHYNRTRIIDKQREGETGVDYSYFLQNTAGCDNIFSRLGCGYIFGLGSR